MRAKRTGPSNGAGANGQVERLIELQALAQMQIAKADERLDRADERMARDDERTARADERFIQLERRWTALQHENSERLQRLEHAIATLMRMLEGLPDAVREKIAFATAKP